MHQQIFSPTVSSLHGSFLEGGRGTAVLYFQHPSYVPFLFHLIFPWWEYLNPFYKHLREKKCNWIWFISYIAGQTVYDYWKNGMQPLMTLLYDAIAAGERIRTNLLRLYVHHVKNIIVNSV
jgi:hypothetical protein